MKYQLIIVLLFSSLVSFGQQPEYPDSGFTNKAEAKNLMVNGKKEGKWVEYEKLVVDSVTSYETYYSSYYVPLDSVKKPTHYRLIVYKSGKAFGLCRVYYINWSENGTLVSEIPFFNGEINGMYKEYSYSKLVSETIYTNGVRGATKNFDENGNEIKQ